MKEDKRRQVKRREEEMSLPDKSCTSRKPKEKKGKKGKRAKRDKYRNKEKRGGDVLAR